MCTNYSPSSRDALRATFDVEPPAADWKPEVWRGYAAPMIRRRESGERTAELAGFGLVPYWIKSRADADRISAGTLNARAETVAEKPSFRSAWQKGQRCLLPMARFYEPDWRSGKAVRTAVGLADGRDFAVAGIWSWWRDPDSEVRGATFSLLTINADRHALMSQLHRPGDEKRSLVIVPRDAWDAWFAAAPDQASAMLTLYPAEAMTLTAAPLPPRTRKPS